MVIVTAVVALIYTAARETSTYFLTMDEYAATANDHDGKDLRLAGRVSDGSVDWNPRTLDLAFQIQSIPERGSEIVPAVAVAEAAEIPTLTIRYNGILPDMFGEGRDVIVEGRVEGQVLHADTLLTTCPSKYEAEIQPDQAKAEGESAING